MKKLVLRVSGKKKQSGQYWHVRTSFPAAFPGQFFPLPFQAVPPNPLSTKVKDPMPPAFCRGFPCFSPPKSKRFPLSGFMALSGSGDGFGVLPTGRAGVDVQVL